MLIADLGSFRSSIHLASDMPSSNVLSRPMTDLFDLTGKVALVTGGSRGLGYQMVKAFAGHGADIFITSRKIEGCEKVAAEVKAMGRRAATHACNVANWTELDGLVAAAYAAFGKIDILVNNAGSSPLAPSSLNTPEQLFDRIVALSSISRAPARSVHGRRSRPMPAPRRHSTRSPRPSPSNTGRRCASTPS